MVEVLVTYMSPLMRMNRPRKNMMERDDIVRICQLSEGFS